MANDKRDAVGNGRFSLTDDPHCGNGSYDDEYGNDKAILDCGEGPASRVLRTVPQELTDAEVEQVKKNLELTDFKNVYITAAGHLIVVDNKGNEYDAGDARGLPGPAPYVGKNGNWWVNDLDTGAQAAGVNPHIGENGNWFVGETDTGVQSQGDTPYVGENGNWWVGGVDLGTPATLLSVGTVLETIRTDLGENWLLCNGDGVSREDYPRLYDLLPYNTKWVEVVPKNEYMHVSPIPNTHKWVRVKRKTGTGTADYAWDKAEVCDAETRTSLTVANPLVVSGKTSLLVGITHDGARYVLAACCYGEITAGRYTMHLYASDDLITWTQFYTYTLTDAAYPSDITFDGASYLLADGYVPSDGSSSSNYARYVWATPADLSGTTRRNTGTGSGYKDARFRPCPQGYYSWDSNNDHSVDIFRAGTGATVMSGSGSYYPRNVAYFSDRYLITVADYSSSELNGFEVFDWTTETKTQMVFSTLFDLPTNIGSRVTSSGAEYDPLLNEWSIYFRHSSTYYRADISADADPTVKGNYKKTVIKGYPDGYQSMLTQMSTNRARWFENSIRDPNLKYLPTHDGDTYKYINATGLGGTTSGGTGECNCEVEFTDDGAGNVTMEVIPRDE